MNGSIVKEGGLTDNVLKGAATLALLALLACGDEDPTGRNGGRIHEVEIMEFAYVPGVLNARVGDTVRWIQRDAVPHTVTSTEPLPGQPGGFDELLNEDGDVVEVELERSGTIRYFCLPHPFMTGSIEVAP